MDTNVLPAVTYSRSVLQLRELVQDCGGVRPEEEKAEITKELNYN